MYPFNLYTNLKYNTILLMFIILKLFYNLFTLANPQKLSEIALSLNIENFVIYYSKNYLILKYCFIRSSLYYIFKIKLPLQFILYLGLLNLLI